MSDPYPDFDLAGALPFDDDAATVTPQKPPDPTMPAVLGEGFKYIGRGLSLAEFTAYVQNYRFGSTPPDYVVLHHTAIPSTLDARYPSGAVWDAGESRMDEPAIYAKRRAQLDAIMRFYRDGKGWNAGPHLFIDDRWLWLFTPMYDVGIHAAKGNSYRDSRGRLHYSIGIEVLGYYEKVVWPASVARNVAHAISALRTRLQTFDYIDGPWSGKIGSHRMYNKPACPGAAIVPSYYMPLLKAAGDHNDNPRPAHPGETHYRVLRAVTGGATVRSEPNLSGNVLQRLHAGDSWWGSEVEGEKVTILGFGSSKIWICSADMRCVSSILLEKVRK
jgi:hypothetical protein